MIVFYHPLTRSLGQDLYDGQKEFNLDDEDVLYLAGKQMTVARLGFVAAL